MVTKKTNKYDDVKYSIKEGSYHHSADLAKEWLIHFTLEHPLEYAEICESISSCALSGNEFANILYGTMMRWRESLGVSDRYLLGYAWAVRDFYEQSVAQEKRTRVKLKTEKKVSRKVQKNESSPKRVAKTKDRKKSSPRCE